MNKKKLVVVAGPTASGKTNAAIQIARHFGTEIISADSRQCYRQMSIGTAKPTEAELAAVPHHFINSHDINEELNAAGYEQLALGYAAHIFSRNNYAVVCGGTGLYIKALCEGIDEMPDTDRNVERALQQEYAEKGMDWLVRATAREDPAFFAVAERQNPVRLMRALAFKRTTGTSITQYRSGLPKKRPFDIIKIALELPREILYERINLRVDQMVAAGLWEEAEELYPLRKMKNLQTVGYSEIFDSIEGKTDSGQAIALIKQHTRNYAKRQVTWFKKDKGFRWFAPQDIDGMVRYIDARCRHEA
ncbi:MAG: tRNA (adenosine(37)-N6)-dimethylallyltransferase MiaA [Edaphocola sp.]